MIISFAMNFPAFSNLNIITGTNSSGKSSMIETLLILGQINEFNVLNVLIENKGKILSRDKIIEELFMDLYDGYDRNVDTYIKNIRAKIEKNSREPEYIMTVYGAGYKFSEKN